MKIFSILIICFVFSASGCGYTSVKQATASVPEFKMGEKMDENEFWKIIDYSSASASGNFKKQEEIITKKLSAYQPEQIVEFEIILTKKLIEANDFKIMAADKIIDGYVSDDTFLYFRCWLIGLGENVFKETIKNPEYLADVVDKGAVPDFEGLLFVSTKAYQNKTGKKEEDDSFPRDVAFKQGLNYDFGGPATTGRDWKEEELPKLYPLLWNKFN